MNLPLPDNVDEILDKFKKAGYQIFIVGGAVRDLLMRREVTDWDFTTDAKPEEIRHVLPDSFYNNKFGTVGLHVDSQIYEITTMRKEGDYRDARHPTEVSWTGNIKEDLSRRDFTINALALKTDGSVIDPFQGQTDLELGIIRAVGEAENRFQEDALRLMRAIRIATQLNFEVESHTLQAISQNAPKIKGVSSERIRDELLKLLGADSPEAGIRLMQETGLLQIILPELAECFGIIQAGPKHDRVYDIGEHSLQTLKFTPSMDPLVRLAALLHDIGKVKTYHLESSGNATFYNHDTVGGQQVLKIAKRFNLSKSQTDKLYRLVRWHLFTVDQDQTDSAIRRFIKNVGLESIDDLLALRIGDRLGGGTQKAVSWRMENFRQRINQVLQKPFGVTDLKVNGNDVMQVLQIPPGRRVGEVLNQLFSEVLEDSHRNSKEYLLKRLKNIKTN